MTRTYDTSPVDPRKKAAFRSQRWNAKRRGIEFKFCLVDWIEWWGDDFELRGVHHGQLVMARNGDLGAYEIGNVFKCLSTVNIASGPKADPHVRSERSKNIHARRIAAGIPSHLAVRGDDHPKSKAVNTPAGRFGSMALAAEHYGVTRQALWYRVKHGADGYAIA